MNQKKSAPLNNLSLNLVTNTSCHPELDSGSQKKSAFTLIELLVVIVIIGILATIGVASFNNYYTRARDMKRLASFKQIITHIQTFTIANGRFPNISYEGGIPAPNCGNWYHISSERSDLIEGIENFVTENIGEVNCANGHTSHKGFYFYMYPANSSNVCPDTHRGRKFIIGTNFEAGSDFTDKVSANPNYCISAFHLTNQGKGLAYTFFENDLR